MADDIVQDRACFHAWRHGYFMAAAGLKRALRHAHNVLDFAAINAIEDQLADLQADAKSA